MQIVRGKDHIPRHELNKPGAYEWWYFDFMDSDQEYSCVIIFLIGSPFSPDYSVPLGKARGRYDQARLPRPSDFCSVSVNVYQKQRVIHRSLYEFNSSLVSVTNDESSYIMRFDKCMFAYDKKSGAYSVEVNFKNPGYKDKIRIEMLMTPAGETVLPVEESAASSHFHFWQPEAVQCNCSLKLVRYEAGRRVKLEINGWGYADHNWGFEPMFSGMRDWYWGRVHAGNHCLVYYHIKYDIKEKEDFSEVLLLENGKVKHASSDFPFRIRGESNYWMLRYGGEVSGSDEHLTLKVNNELLIDNGPFYVRSLGQFDVSYKGENIASKATGITEYISPSRLKSSFLRPFVKLRIRRLE